jgi:hypothetical protein
MEAIRSSETSMNFYQTTRRHIPEDSDLHGYLHENIRTSSVKIIPSDLVCPPSFLIITFEKLPLFPSSGGTQASLLGPLAQTSIKEYLYLGVQYSTLVFHLTETKTVSETQYLKTWNGVQSPKIQS